MLLASFLEILVRKFYVTLTKSVRAEQNGTLYEEVIADEAIVGYAGELAFCNENGSISVVYAPGTWVLFTEDTPAQ